MNLSQKYFVHCNKKTTLNILIPSKDDLSVFLFSSFVSLAGLSLLTGLESESGKLDFSVLITYYFTITEKIR